MDKVTYLQGKVDKLDDPRDRQPVVLRHIADIVAERREPDWLRHQILEKGVLATLAGPRGTFKSFIALDWAMWAAAAGHPVVILSGEGAGLDRRADAWMRVHGKNYNAADLPVRALERPLNLNLTAELLAVREGIGDQHPDLIVVDTLSKFSAGMDENSNAEVSTFLSRLTTELKLVYQATVLLVAHTGHGDSKRPRGASALMANPDAEYIVTRAPESMVVEVTRERFKDYPSLPPLVYEAEVIDLGRTDRYGTPVNSLALRPTEAAYKPLAPEPKGKAQRLLLEALRARRAAGTEPVAYTLSDLRQIGRECGMHKNSARAAADALVFTPFMLATVGGWKLTDV